MAIDFHRRYGGTAIDGDLDHSEGHGLLGYSTQPRGYAIVQGPETGRRRFYRVSPAEAGEFRIWLLWNMPGANTGQVRLAGTYPHYTLLPEPPVSQPAEGATGR